MFIRYFVACCCILSVLEGTIVVNNGAELQSGIIAVNAGSDTLIQFGSSFSYFTELQPLNAGNVLNFANQTFTIDGQGRTLAQNASLRGFFARASIGTVTIQDLTIDGAHAKGGNGGPHAGGGLGAGGGLFLNSGSTVILDNISFQNCKATGGSGNVSGDSGGGGGGFGEMAVLAREEEARGLKPSGARVRFSKASKTPKARINRSFFIP